MVDAAGPTQDGPQPTPAFKNADLAPDGFQARSSDELTLGKGDRVELLERDDEFGDGWFLGRHLGNGNSGLFPEGLYSFFSLDMRKIAKILFSLHTNCFEIDNRTARTSRNDTKLVTGGRPGTNRATKRHIFCAGNSKNGTCGIISTLDPCCITP